jgi:flagellar basal body L-ring protein FlgH
MKNTEDEVLVTEQIADANMTYCGDGQPFEESELEALERTFNARKDYLELGYPRF